MILRYSDEALIEGLRQRKQRHIDYLYHEFTPIVRHLVKQNSGNQSDVSELVHETIIVLYKRALDQNFKLTCSLKTFFFSICKNLWLQRLDRKYRLFYQADFEINEPLCNYNLDDMDLKEEELIKDRLLYKNIQSLSMECQRILELYILKTPYKKIAKLMNFKSETEVKARKYACKKLLRSKIMNDVEYKQFFEYERYGNNKRLD